MSADNRLCIMRGECERWYVWEGSMSVSYYQPPRHCLKDFCTEKEATDYAMKESENYTILEYGVQTITTEEQMQGLAYEIEDLSMRLRKLIVSGHQFDINFN